MKETGDEFLDYLQDEDYENAFEMLHPELKSEEGEWRSFAGWLRDSLFSVDSWTTSSRSIEDDYGELEGVITDLDGDKWDYYLALVEEGGEWRIYEYSFDPW